MKNKFKIIIVCLLLFILLLESRFFYLMPVPTILNKFNNYTNKMIISVFVLLSFLVYFVKKCIMRDEENGRIRFDLSSLLEKKLIIALATIWLMQFIYSYFRYKEGISSLISSSYHYLIILLYFPLIYLIYEFKYYYKMIDILAIVSIIVSVLFIVQAFYYNANMTHLNGKAVNDISNIFLNIFELKSGIGKFYYRSGGIRLNYSSTLITFSMMTSASIIIDSKKILDKNKIIHFLNIFISIIYLFEASKTRMLILTVFISILSMVLYKILCNIKFKNKKYNFKLPAIIYLGIVLLMVILLKDNIMSILKTKINFSSGSIYARMEGLNHYLGYLKSNIINGIGFINGDNELTKFILNGEKKYLFITDVGILGITVSLGIFGLVWYLWMIVDQIKIFLMTRKYKNQSVVHIGFIVFLILSTPTIIILNSQRIILLPIIWAIIDYNKKILKGTV